MKTGIISRVFSKTCRKVFTVLTVVIFEDYFWGVTGVKGADDGKGYDSCRTV